MILDTRTGVLIDYKATYRLTQNQKKLLMLLSDNYNHTNKEIMKYLDYMMLNNVSVALCNLRKKVKSLQITYRVGIGCRLKNIVFLTYGTKTIKKPKKAKNQKLVDLIYSRKMTYVELARRLGWSMAKLSYYINKANSKVETNSIIDLAQVLDVSVTEIIECFK